MSVTIDYSRQGHWFVGYQFNKQVHVIGVGATGSFVAYQLAKMGVRQLHIWDYDQVEEHNIANQVYGLSDVGKNKVDALKERIIADTGIEVTAHNEKVTSATKDRLVGIVYVLVDSMSARKDIFSALKFNPRIELIVETRMSIDCGRIYNVNPMNMEMVQKYEKTLYEDDVAEVSFCGSSLSIIPTAMNIASLASWSVIKNYRGLEQIFETILDYNNNNVIVF